MEYNVRPSKENVIQPYKREYYMPESVSGANRANPYISAGWQAASPHLKKLGLDTDQIGKYLNGDFSGVTDGAVDALVSDPAANAAVKGVIDIVQVVLAGNYKKGADVQEAKQDLNNITNLCNFGNALADSSTEEANNILTRFGSDLSGVQVSVDESVNQITLTLENGQQEFIQLSKDNIEVAEKFAENQSMLATNNTLIEQKQARLTELSSQISAKKAQLGGNNDSLSSFFTPVDNNSQGGSDGLASSQFANMSLDGINDPELRELIEEYNVVGADIANLQMQNQAISLENMQFYETMTSNTSLAEENTDNMNQVTDEQSANIDENVRNVTSMCRDAKSAVGEVQRLLQGQFPKIDKVVLVKLATSMTKAAICGTNSGLLAAAASAAGVSSLFSLGMTASKSFELGEASVDQALANFEHIATNVAGSALEKVMTTSINQSLAYLSNVSGVDLSQMQAVTNDLIAGQLSNVNSAIQNNQQVLKENPVDQDGIA